MSAVCAWCGVPRGLGTICGKCGADYEKAAQIKAGKKPETSERKPAVSKKSEREALRQQRFLDAWQPVKDPKFEHKLCLSVVPSMLAFCFLLEIVGIGDGLLRIVFGMPIHEMGHALVGWFSGFNSVPTLWKTLIPSERGFVAPIILFGALAYLINFARHRALGGLLLLAVFLLILQFIGTFVLTKGTAGIYVTWGGDGVGMMLATALMIGFNFDKHTNWYKGYLRWGFAFIGAAAFVDMAFPWWVSLNDVSAVPYGSTGGTHTDTYKLVVYHGWDMNDVIHRYVMLSVLCMLVLGVFFIRGVKQSAKAVQLHRLQTDHEAEAIAKIVSETD